MAASATSSSPITTSTTRKVSAVSTAGWVARNWNASGGKKAESPKVSFAVGVTKRSASRVWLIHASTVLRNEKTITLTPTVIATATASAATVTELRRSARRRLPAANSVSIRTRPRARYRRKKMPAVELKRNISRGTRRANPAMTKNAATKLSQRGPVERASHEKTAAAIRNATPPTNHAGEGIIDRSILVPP